MGFPLSMSGHVAIPSAANSRVDTLACLERALSAETVDNVRSDGAAVTFKANRSIRALERRPRGGDWLFGPFDDGRFWVTESSAQVRIDYALTTRWFFATVSLISMAVGTLIHISGGVQSQWGFVFALGMWVVVFLSQYISKAIELRRWLRAIMTAPETVRVRPLKLVDSGG